MKDQGLFRIQLLFLLLAGVLESSLTYFSTWSFKLTFSTVLYLPVSIFVFFFFFFLVFRWFFLKKSRILLIVNTVAGIILYFIFGYCTMKFIIGPVIYPNQGFFENIAITNSNFLITATLKLITFLIYALLFSLFEMKLIAERERTAINTQKLQIEYDYLKSQINPHFLYNTLSFFYSRMLKNDKGAANGIAALSDIMRYSLEGGDREGKVMLEKEVEQIENYIMLQQLRFDGQLYIDFKYNTPLPAVAILPHAFITIVENAFKHGVTDDPDNPLSISLHATGQEVLFEVKNKKNNQRKDNTPGGLGLQNLRERLALAYPGKHQYLITDNNNDYATSLRITTQTTNNHERNTY